MVKHFLIKHSWYHICNRNVLCHTLLYCFWKFHSYLEIMAHYKPDRLGRVIRIHGYGLLFFLCNGISFVVVVILLSFACLVFLRASQWHTCCTFGTFVVSQGRVVILISNNCITYTHWPSIQQHYASPMRVQIVNIPSVCPSHHVLRQNTKVQ